MSTETTTEENAYFCVFCFGASSNELGASWGGDVGNNYCMNCGANGPNLLLPEWTIKSIRKQASWVGKRYYPNEEDTQTAEELKLLRALVPHDSGRIAEYVEADPEIPDHKGYWSVKQDMGGGKATWITVDAESEEEALAMAKIRLPYHPLENDNG